MSNIFESKTDAQLETFKETLIYVLGLTELELAKRKKKSIWEKTN